MTSATWPVKRLTVSVNPLPHVSVKQWYLTLYTDIRFLYLKQIFENVIDLSCIGLQYWITFNTYIPTTTISVLYQLFYCQPSFWSYWSYQLTNTNYTIRRLFLISALISQSMTMTKALLRPECIFSQTIISKSIKLGQF